MKYHLKLKKALSYNGVVSATRKNPDVYTEDKATAEAAVATGYFDLVEYIEDDPNPADHVADTGEMVKGHLDAEQLIKDYKLDELKDLAAKLGITTPGLRTKEDYAKAIAAVEVEAPSGDGVADFSEE